MTEYKDKKELMDEISNRAKLFIDEFSHIKEDDKDKLIDGVDRTPAQMVAYQLGWLNLLLYWEDEEQQGNTVITPHPDYKWNNLGGLYESFYRQYEKYSLQELCTMFQEAVQKIIELTEQYTDAQLFQPGVRKWASSTPSSWAVWKWIHINTVAPFKSFRSKVRKWKKLNCG
ncbi:ClbS/DfsB family four-helix bundle protein [Lacrimispora indolis]|uniref:ClbS/DfsB family four-helix bundle protein n=1 Tax=Lacrimispora indolis TaxID=69825 RepID=UPI0003FE188B|nr:MULTISPECIES: ClbS/DfsB family four-helix bundle protein [Lachnospiraceae]MBE7722086.1 ClbS/DfsB family four-helix bundle protein [Lacrimispora celerecrescens]